MNELPAPPAKSGAISTWWKKFIWTVVGLILLGLLAIGLSAAGVIESEPEPVTWAEFVDSHGGPGGVCDVQFSEVPTHLAEQWGRRCITGAG